MPILKSTLRRVIREEIEHIMLTEQANTLAADVNEILLGYYCLGGKWTGFQGAGEAKEQLEKRKKALPATEFADATGRAQVMADETLKWAASNGYSGKVKKAWWTARPGVLSSAVGQEVDSRKNPTDTLLQFSDGKFLGLSAKATKSKGDIGFKNPGLGTIENALSLSLKGIVDKKVDAAIKKHDLPKSAGPRKKAIRADSNIQADTVKMGTAALKQLRDALYKKLSSMKPKDLREHLVDEWMDAKIVYPPYIKVTGHGKNGNYTASIMDPLDNPKLKALSRDKLSVEKVGNDSIGIKAGTKKIMKMRFKFESEKLASSVKMSGEPW